MKIINKTWIDNGSPLSTFSVVSQEFLVKEGVEIPLGSEHRCAVTPLDKENIGDLDETIQSMLKAIWTDEVVHAFKAYINQLEEEPTENEEI